MTLEIIDYLNDPVHGRVALTSIERDIVNTPTFLRLAKIAQLGLGQLVFPGATHTRLSHSIGVLAVMSRICEQLKISPEEAQVLRLAALLHDIGQYPLSHAIEHVYRQIGRPTSPEAHLFKNPEDLDTALEDIPLIARAVQQAPGTSYARDKDLAEFVILQRDDLQDIWKKHSVSEDKQKEIAQIIRGKSPNTLYGFLLDSEYDCDRMDYIRRDAFYSGVPYGQIDLHFLIENLEARRPTPSSRDDVLAVRRKVIRTFEHFLLSRHYMYSQVTFNRQIRGFEIIAKAAFHGMAEEQLVYENFDAVKNMVPTEDFLKFDDTYFHSSVRNASSNGSLDDRTKKLCSMAVFQQPAWLVDEETLIINVADGVRGDYARKQVLLKNDDNLRDICESANVDIDNIGVEELSIDFLPFPSGVPIADVVGGRVRANDLTMVPWILNEENDRMYLIHEDSSSIISHLSQTQLRILRVFVSSSSDEADRFRSELQRRSRI